MRLGSEAEAAHMCPGNQLTKLFARAGAALELSEPEAAGENCRRKTSVLTDRNVAVPM
jgi:hypothetical protein